MNTPKSPQMEAPRTPETSTSPRTFDRRTMMHLLGMTAVTAFAGRILAACDNGNGGADGGASGAETGSLADGESSADGVGLPSDTTDTDLPSDVTNTDDGANMSDLPDDVTPASDVTPDTDDATTSEATVSDAPNDVTATDTTDAAGATDSGQTVTDAASGTDTPSPQDVADTATTTFDAGNAYDDANNLECNTVDWCKTQEGEIGVLAGCDVNGDGKIDPGETTCIQVCSDLKLPCTKPDGTSGNLQMCDFDNNGSYGEPGKNELICD